MKKINNSQKKLALILLIFSLSLISISPSNQNNDNNQKQKVLEDNDIKILPEEKGEKSTLSNDENKKTKIATTITVEGKSKGSIKSDIMKVGFLMESKGPNAEKVVEENDSKIKVLENDLRNLGVSYEKKNLKNLGFLVDLYYPNGIANANGENNNNSNDYKFIGLTTFEISTDDEKLLPKILNFLKQRKIRINYVLFTSSNNAMYYLSDILTEAAMNNAYEKAKNSLDQKGYEIGEILNMNVMENFFKDFKPKGSEKSEGSIKDIKSKENKTKIYEVKVRVTYELVKSDGIKLKKHKARFPISKIHGY